MFTSKNRSKQICLWFWCERTTGDGLFHWRKCYGLWTQKRLWICFLQTWSFTFHIFTCGLLWCFYQLFGLSFWRHSFMHIKQIWSIMSLFCNKHLMSHCFPDRMFWFRSDCMCCLLMGCLLNTPGVTFCAVMPASSEWWFTLENNVLKQE